MVNKLIKLANRLDKSGFIKEADTLDSILKTLLQNSPKVIEKIQGASFEDILEVFENPEKLKEYGKEIVESSICEYLSKPSNKNEVSDDLVEKIHDMIDDFEDCNDLKFINIEEIKSYIKDMVTSEKISNAIECFCSNEVASIEENDEEIISSKDICDIEINFCKLYFKYMDQDVKKITQEYMNEYIDSSIGLDLDVISESDVDRLISCIIKEIGLC